MAIAMFGAANRRILGSFGDTEMACQRGLALAFVAALSPLLSFAAEPAARPIVNSIGMKLARIPAGEFVMGNNESHEQLAKGFPQYEAKRIEELTDEPPHKVRITKPFYMGVHEVTIEQFKRFIKESGYVVESERDGTGGWGY